MVSAAPGAVDMDHDTPVEQKAPQERLKLASTFDRLVDSNLKLTESNHLLSSSVHKLVGTLYLSLAVGSLGLLIVVGAVLAR